MSRHARAADHAYLQRLRRAKLPPMPTFGDSFANRLSSLNGDRACDACGLTAEHRPSCMRAITFVPNTARPEAQQPAPEPQPTWFAVGDVVRCYRKPERPIEPWNTMVGCEYTITKECESESDTRELGHGDQWLTLEGKPQCSSYASAYFELVRRAGEAPAPAGQLREGWANYPCQGYAERYRFEDKGVAFKCGSYFLVHGIDDSDLAEILDGDTTHYPTLDAAQDAVESAALGAEGWTRADDFNVRPKWIHASDMRVWETGDGWTFSERGGASFDRYKTRAEAMRIALGQVKV